MACQNCGHSVRVRKSLGMRKSAMPDECPECGVELSKGGANTLLTKDVGN